MKQYLDYTHPDIVEIYDEIPLWSAPFGRLLLDNIPMGRSWKIVDLGFGTGFPLIELAQRFDKNSSIIGYDIWESAIIRAKKKVKLLNLENITIHRSSAFSTNEKTNTVDLVCSNLGVNNFTDRDKVLDNVYKILKTDGHFCITTNSRNSMSELHDIFLQSCNEIQIDNKKFNDYIENRDLINILISEIKAHGFRLTNRKTDTNLYRFSSGETLLDHSIIRIAFMDSWKSLIPSISREKFFNRVISLIDDIVDQKGEFRFTVPMNYLHFQKI